MAVQIVKAMINFAEGEDRDAPIEGLAGALDRDDRGSRRGRRRVPSQARAELRRPVGEVFHERQSANRGRRRQAECGAGALSARAGRCGSTAAKRRASGETIERLSPAHGVLVTRVPRGGASDARLAIAAARRAFDSGPWPKETASNRARALLKTADLIDRDRELLATLDALEFGKPIAQARGEIEGAADIWRYAASLARELSGESYANLGPDRLGFVLREPIGVVSIITPWNFPLLIVSQKLPFALAAGCTCVVKPSEMTSASTLHLAALLAEAGLPEGVCNVVTGYGPEVGAPMTSDADVDMVSFTGSTRVGRAAMAAAAATLKKVSMELGGKNPQVIFPDADMDAALDAATFGAYFNAGECCNAGSRLLLHADIAAGFLAELAERAASVPVGDPLDEATRVGALISPDHLGKVEAHVRDARGAGAKVQRRRRAAGLERAVPGADHRRGRHDVDGDRQRGSVRARRRRSDVQDRRRGDRDRQRHGLRAVGERVEPGSRHARSQSAAA